MKKHIAIFLVIFTLCLTACNNQTVEPSTTSGKTEQTESTGISQSTEISQTTQIPQTSVPTETSTETNEKPIEANGYVVPDELKDKIVYPQRAWFMDFPSRIVFSQKCKSQYIGNIYYSSGGNKIVYYSKADGETYYNCFDPLCDHSTCALSGIIDTSNMAVYNNRFFEFDDTFGAIYSFSFDGSDVKKEYQMFEQPINGLIPFKALAAYDRYWYILYLHEDGTDHCLRFDMETNEMIDLTEKTKNHFFPSYFYNGEIYGIWDDGTIKKSDLSLTKIENSDIDMHDQFVITHTIGQLFVGYIREWGTTEKGESVLLHSGIYTYHIETGEETFISSEMIGKNIVCTLYADEHYIYFLSDDTPLYIGKDNRGIDVYNNKSKLWRVNRDGTNCICVYDNIKTYLRPYPLMIYENKIFIYASEIGIIGGISQKWNEGMYIGTIQSDGTIDKLEYIEVIE